MRYQLTWGACCLNNTLINLGRYGLSQEQIVEAETALEELAAQAQSRDTADLLPLVNIMGESPSTSISFYMSGQLIAQLRVQ